MTATERAMCTEAEDRIRELEAEVDRLRALGQMALGMLEAIWTGAMDGAAPNPEALRERIDWYAAEFAPATDDKEATGA